MPDPKEKKSVQGGMADGLFQQRKTIKIIDPRQKNYRGEPLQLNRTGDYDENVIKQTVMAANKLGNDPYTMLALTGQETGWGTAQQNNGQNNWGQVLQDEMDNNPAIKKLVKDNPDINPYALGSNYIFKQKQAAMAKEPDEAKRIQAYNGFRLNAKNDSGSTNLYGIDLTKYPNGYDLKADPRYGYNVKDLRDNVIKQNPDLVNYVNSLSQQGGMSQGMMPQQTNPFEGVTVAQIPSANGKRKMQFMKDGQMIKEVEVDGQQFDGILDKKQKGDFLKSLFQQQ